LRRCEFHTCFATRTLTVDMHLWAAVTTPIAVEVARIGRGIAAAAAAAAAAVAVAAAAAAALVRAFNVFDIAGGGRGRAAGSAAAAVAVRLRGWAYIFKLYFRCYLVSYIEATG